MYLTHGNYVEHSYFVMPDKDLTLAWPLTSTAKAFSMTRMSVLLLSVICSVGGFVSSLLQNLHRALHPRAGLSVGHLITLLPKNSHPLVNEHSTLCPLEAPHRSRDDSAGQLLSACRGCLDTHQLLSVDSALVDAAPRVTVQHLSSNPSSAKLKYRPSPTMT
jgi:hypothetical protein